MDRVQAQGHWCRSCEVFEDEDFTEMGTDQCMGCSCHPDKHTAAQVVT